MVNPLLAGILGIGGDMDQQQPLPYQELRAKLNPQQTILFDKWKSQLPQNLQWEKDYDLKGLWLENPNAKPSSNLHFPDTYKLPNHPTFSDESKFFNKDTKKFAGHWQETPTQWNYVPYDTTVKKPITEKKGS